MASLSQKKRELLIFLGILGTIESMLLQMIQELIQNDINCKMQK